MKKVIILKSEKFNPYLWHKDLENEVIEIDSIDDRGFGILRKNGVLDKVIEPQYFAEVKRYKFKNPIPVYIRGVEKIYKSFDAHESKQIVNGQPQLLIHLANTKYFCSVNKIDCEELKSGGLSFDADFSETIEKYKKISDSFINDAIQKENLSKLDQSKFAAENLIDSINKAKKALETVRFPFENPLLNWNPSKYNFRCNTESDYNKLSEAFKKITYENLLTAGYNPLWKHFKVGPVDASQLYKLGVDVAKPGSDKTVIGVFESGPDAGKPVYKGDFKIDGITVSEGEKVAAINQPHTLTETFEKLFEMTAEESDYIKLKAYIKDQPDLFYHLVKKFIKSKGIAKMQAERSKNSNSFAEKLKKSVDDKIESFNYGDFIKAGYIKTDLIDTDALRNSIEHESIELTYKGLFKKNRSYLKNDFVLHEGDYYMNTSKKYFPVWKKLTGKTFKVKF